MNCETCEALIHDWLDGAISQSDESALNIHLKECLDCESVRKDLASIVGFCRTHRGEYSAPPNEKALWLRIRNTIEIDAVNGPVSGVARAHRSFLSQLMSRSWELSLPQLTALTAAIVLVVSLATMVGLRRWDAGPTISNKAAVATTSDPNDRVWQQQQLINYWNQRVEVNKARWNSNMRETFDRNMKVIDEAVSESLNELQRNPHDEISEQMLNDSLNDKLTLLKEFSDL
ncbi:MAG: anti-sigma factor [Pyrinomonadaceae bacterium]